MKKFLLYGIFISAFTLSFTACSDDDNGEPWTEPEVVTTGAYILNSGSQGANVVATLGHYNPENKVYTRNVFQNQNGGMLIGNTGNDLVIYGSKMYILATGSNKIYITDLNSQLLKYNDGTDAIIDPISQSGEPAGPRFALAHGGKVYVSTNAGYVAQIDTTSMVIERTATVGSYPEQMAIVGNNMYVANSGYGSGNTLSLVNLNTFTETKKIPVHLNPNKVVSDANGIVYIASWGNNIETVFQKLDTKTEVVTEIGRKLATNLTMSNDKKKIFIVNSVYDESWNNTVSLTYYDITNNEYVNSPFVTVPASVDLSRATSVSVDPVSGDIYITTSDYLTNGDMYVFAADGTYKNSFDTGGMNPIGAYFVTGIK